MDTKKGLKKFAWLVYALIVFEIIYMISPFAFFYYSAYKLPLKFLQESESTSWLVQFILPHFAYSKSAIVNVHNQIGWTILLVGLVLFVGGFCQIYYAKLFKKREVTGGLYKYIRHPQYVSLAIVGLGTLLVWPRFLILITFVTMIFLYYFLARFEEKECLEKFGDKYAEYVQKTGMFFPRLGLLSRFSVPKLKFLPERGVTRILAICFLYIVIMAATLSFGNAVRNYSISNIASYSDNDSFVLSLTDLNRDEIKNIYEITLSSGEVRAKVLSDKKYLVYILPEAWHIPELPASFKPEHVTPKDYDRNLYKALITEAIVQNEAATGNDLFKSAIGFDPSILAFVNVKEKSVTRTMNPPTSKWAGIAVPLF